MNLSHPKQKVCKPYKEAILFHNNNPTYRLDWFVFYFLSQNYTVKVIYLNCMILIARLQLDSMYDKLHPDLLTLQRSYFHKIKKECAKGQATNRQTKRWANICSETPDSLAERCFHFTFNLLFTLVLICMLSSSFNFLK